jgi:hypothetical protein
MIQSVTILLLNQVAQPQVKIEIQGNYRVITANGIPNHTTGQFPNRGNPNSISPQRYSFRVPANPKISEKPTPLQHQDFGVAINGIPFDPLTAEFYNRDRNSGWNEEAIYHGIGGLGIDQANAHVQPTGAYHYHSVPLPLVSSKNNMILVGWAADGFPMYGPYGPTDPMDLKSTFKALRGSFKLKEGTRPSGPGGVYDGKYVQDWEYKAKLGDLDECNGRFGITPEFPNGTYYYVVTNDYPWVPRNFKGTPDPSFQRRPGPPPGGGRGRPGGPPPQSKSETHTHDGTTHTH